MSGEITLTDPTFTRNTSTYNAFERFLLSLINDERDLVFVKLIIELTVLVIPFTIYFYSVDKINWWIGATYLALNWLLFMGRYLLMLHCTSHRRLFKTKFNWMNNIVPWALAPYFGVSPETYFTHHIGMHHPENNLKDDISSTMGYQRDSFIDFLLYFLRFFFLGVADISSYFIKKNRKKLMFRTFLGEGLWYIAMIALSFVNFHATLIVFIIPLVFTRFMLMAGNWGQHAFVDANDPGNCYRNSITCINSMYNRRCFNDGYHIVHHINPHMHYTDMPEEFLQNRDTYAKEKAIIFEGLDFFLIWLLLMTKSYGILAKKFVKLDDSFTSQEQIIEFLKSRTAKIQS